MVHALNCAAWQCQWAPDGNYISATQTGPLARGRPRAARLVPVCTQETEIGPGASLAANGDGVGDGPPLLEIADLDSGFKLV